MLHNQFNPRQFEGVVESRHDPLKAGRVQVRVFGIHTENLSNIPTSDLHWMQVALPVTSASNSGVSDTPYLIEGTHVIGYFRDGDLCQDGIITHSIVGIPQQARNPNVGFNDVRKDLSMYPKVATKVISTESQPTVTENPQAYPRYIDSPDLSPLTRNIDSYSYVNRKDNRIVDILDASGGKFSEPLTENKSQYPFNQVTEYESGHTVEFDNTPNNERISLTHRLGSYFEIKPNGDIVSKSINQSHSFIHNSSYEYIGGNRTVTVKRGCSVLVNAEGGSGGYIIEVGAGGDMKLTVKGGNLNINVNGDITESCSGDYRVNVGGDYILSASTINLN